MAGSYTRSGDSHLDQVPYRPVCTVKDSTLKNSTQSLVVPPQTPWASSYCETTTTSVGPVSCHRCGAYNLSVSILVPPRCWQVTLGRRRSNPPLSTAMCGFSHPIISVRPLPSTGPATKPRVACCGRTAPSSSVRPHQGRLHIQAPPLNDPVTPTLAHSRHKHALDPLGSLTAASPGPGSVATSSSSRTTSFR